VRPLHIMTSMEGRGLEYRSTQRPPKTFAVGAEIGLLGTETCGWQLVQEQHCSSLSRPEVSDRSTAANRPARLRRQDPSPSMDWFSFLFPSHNTTNASTPYSAARFGRPTTWVAVGDIVVCGTCILREGTNHRRILGQK